MQSVKQLCPQFFPLFIKRSFNHSHQLRNLHHLHTLMTVKERREPPPFVVRQPVQACPFRSSSSLPRNDQAAAEPELDKLYSKIILDVRGHEDAVLSSYVKFLEMAAKELDVTIEKVEVPWRHIQRRTVLRAAFVQKKHREQYEWRTHFRTIHLKHLTGSTADTFLEYIERNLPEGVGMIVSRYQLETIPGHLKPPTSDSNPKIEETQQQQQ